jgi:cob(I)alamin adenosyltransferase
MSEAERRAAREQGLKKGLVIVYTGDGKGKTTAALGTLLRAWGRDMSVAVVQFLKNEHARFGEIRAAEKLGIDWNSTGDGFTWRSRNLNETAGRTIAGWELAKGKIASGRYDVLLLDEFTYPLHYGWLNTAEVIAWLMTNKPPMLHLIITGRYAPPELIAYADVVTEMRCVKHPLAEQGIRAQAGIEF